MTNRTEQGQWDLLDRALEKQLQPKHPNFYARVTKEVAQRDTLIRSLLKRTENEDPKRWVIDFLKAVQAGKHAEVMLNFINTTMQNIAWEARMEVSKIDKYKRVKLEGDFEILAQLGSEGLIERGGLEGFDEESPFGDLDEGIPADVGSMSQVRREPGETELAGLEAGDIDGFFYEESEVEEAVTYLQQVFMGQVCKFVRNSSNLFPEGYPKLKWVKSDDFKTFPDGGYSVYNWSEYLEIEKREYEEKRKTLVADNSIDSLMDL